MVNQNISSFSLIRSFLFYKQRTIVFLCYFGQYIDVTRFFQLHSPKYTQTVINGQQDYLQALLVYY
jgi:hypothetical protein